MPLVFANPYIPWDPSFAKALYTAVSTAIGNGVNVGIVVFGILVGIALVTRVVKMFTKGGR